MRRRSAPELAAARRAAAIRRATGRELARLREDAGLGKAAIGRAAHLSGSSIGRIEDATVEADLETLVRLAAVLGCDVSVRLFPIGPPLRDRFQAPMLEAVLESAGRAWIRHPEVPVVGTVRGVVDCVLAHPTRPLLVAMEVQSELRRAEETLRRSADKAEALRGSSLAAAQSRRLGVETLEVSRLLVLRSTRTTRQLVAELSRTFAAAYPARTVDALAALRDPARPWPGAALVWVHLHGRTATVMDGPPRGVTVGR